MGYFKQEYETDKKKIAGNWEMAIGLQQVDDLKPSDYLVEVAKDNIDGHITYEQIYELLYRHYEEEELADKNFRQKECDLVSARIADYLGNSSFSLSPETLKSMHRFLFVDIYDHAGKFRVYNISKKEPILGGRSVIYADYRSIQDTLTYDFREEHERTYKGLDQKKIVKRISKFVSDIWQVHPFMEGNTRTTALFTERYLNSMGFCVDNEIFAQNAKYFRNALVRANYANFKEGIFTEQRYLENFFENLLYGSEHKLQNRILILENFLER